MSDLLANMLLGVDAGNSMVKFAVFSGSNIVARFVSPISAETLDAAVVTARLSEAGVLDINAIALASVGPHGDALHETLSRLCPTIVRLHAGLDLGVTNLYEQPSSVGIDRLLNAIAAHALYGGPIVVADVGTATNFECVGARGEFLGGAICAGPQLGLDALSSRSKRLLQVDFGPPRSFVATNTSDALKSGAYHGHAHMLDGMLRQFQATLGKQCKAVVTGGYATELFPLLRSATHLNADLTLQGVRLAFEHLQR
jgi:type III pantothenate kinase